MLSNELFKQVFFILFGFNKFFLFKNLFFVIIPVKLFLSFLFDLLFKEFMLLLLRIEVKFI